MKKVAKIFFLTVALTLSTVMFSSLLAQPMPGGTGGDPGPSGGGGGTPVGGFVPVGSGLIILLALGAGYGTKKVYDARKKLAE